MISIPAIVIQITIVSYHSGSPRYHATTSRTTSDRVISLRASTVSTLSAIASWNRIGSSVKLFYFCWVFHIEYYLKFLKLYLEYILANHRARLVLINPRVRIFTRPSTSWPHPINHLRKPLVNLFMPTNIMCFCTSLLPECILLTYLSSLHLCANHLLKR